MLDQPWPVLAGAVAVVLFFVSLLTYAMIVGARKEKHEQQAIAARKQLDTQKMIRKMHERHQGSSLLGMEPESQLVLTTEETPVGSDGSSEIEIKAAIMSIGLEQQDRVAKMRNVGTLSGSLENKIKQVTAQVQQKTRDIYSNPHRATRSDLHSMIMAAAIPDEPPMLTHLERRVLFQKGGANTASDLDHPDESESLSSSIRSVMEGGQLLERMAGPAWVIDGVPVVWDRDCMLLRCGDRVVNVDHCRTPHEVEQAIRLFRFHETLPPRGELLNKYCDGLTFMATFADGDGGTYQQAEAYNSTQCGYDQH